MTPTVLGVLSGVSILATAIVLRNVRATHETLRAKDRARRVALNTSATASPQETKPLFHGTFALIVVGVAALFTVTTLVNFIIALVVVGAGGFAYRMALSALEQRRLKAYERSLPLALDELAHSLRSGAGLVNALAEVSKAVPGDVATDLSVMAREVALGRTVQAALQGWALRRRTRSVRLAVAALSLAVNTGAAQAQTVETVAATVRQFVDAEERASTAATESRASAWALSILPLIISGPVIVLNDDARQFMLHTPIGIAVLCTGLAMNACGALVMRRMIRGVVA